MYMYALHWIAIYWQVELSSSQTIRFEGANVFILIVNKFIQSEEKPKVKFENITYKRYYLNLFFLSQKGLPVLKIEGGGEVNMWTN